MNEKISEYAGRINDYADKISYKYADDMIQRKSIKVSLVATLILWIILIVAISFMPVFEKKDKYKTIQITLAPIETVREVKEAEHSTAKNSEVKKSAEQKAQAAPQSKPKAAPAPAKTEPQAKAPSTQPLPKASSNQPVQQESAPKKAVIKYKKSVDDLLSEQTNGSTSKKTTWDDSMFGTENSTSSSSSDSPQVKTQSKLDNSSALSGTAATATSSDGKAVSQNETGSPVDTKATSDTQNALGRIQEAKTYTTTIGDGLSSKATAVVQTSGDGKVSLQMADGSSRVLLYPSKPVIYISEENGRLIDSTRQVKISFKVLASGNVPLSWITFSPAAVLPQEIRSEIAQQIKDWRFSSAASDGQAVFEYSIIKR